MAPDATTTGNASPAPTVDAAAGLPGCDIPNAIAIYGETAGWIRFADAKAGATVAVNGVLSTFLVPTLRDVFLAQSDTWLRTSIYGIFGLWAVTMLLSSAFAFCCIIPFRPNGQHPVGDRSPHFHSAATVRRYTLDNSDQFVRDVEALDVRQVNQEIVRALLVDAHIAERKYRYVRHSIRLLVLVASSAFVYLILLQFLTPHD